MKKILVVYNPRSSHHGLIQEEVLAKLRQVRGFMVGKFEVKAKRMHENARDLARLVNDDDLVIVAGGDGTVAMAMNGIMLSQKNVCLGVMGYGNFNDINRMVNQGQHRDLTDLVDSYGAGATKAIWPLEIKVNDQHWRYAPCYVTAGLFAESTEVFDDEEVRRKLLTGKKGTVYSLAVLAKWYFRNRRRGFLPKCRLNGEELDLKTTDFMAINSPTMAKILHGGEWYLSRAVFGQATGRLRSFWRLCKFMLKGIFGKAKVKEVEASLLEFDMPAQIELQAEGEYERLDGVLKVEVCKAERCIRVV